MTDYDKFVKLFKAMGVPYHTYDHKKNKWGQCSRPRTEPKKSMYCLTVSQAAFCFNREKRYIGVISDEMQYFEPRVKFRKGK